MKNKKRKELKEPKENKAYKIFMDILTITGVIISILSLYIAILVRKDTAELSKFSDKPSYYTISLYPTDNYEAQVNDKYLSINLKLVIDDFQINKHNFLNVNYNAVFTKTKYYMVYDYDIQNNNYKYMRYELDDKTEGKMRFEDDYYIAPVRLNYSITPNKEYCYLLIYTETTSEKHLDLLLFKYHDSDKSFTLDTVLDDKGNEKIDTEVIDKDVYICKEYFIDLWSGQDVKAKSDLSFMFDVYEDLYQKLILS